MAEKEREPLPLSEIPPLGRHVVGAYYNGLIDSGVFGYGEEYKVRSMISERWGIPLDQIGISDNEGHPRVYISPEANLQVGQRLLEMDSHDKRKYSHRIPAGYWVLKLRSK